MLYPRLDYIVTFWMLAARHVYENNDHPNEQRASKLRARCVDKYGGIGGLHMQEVYEEACQLAMAEYVEGC